MKKSTVVAIVAAALSGPASADQGRATFAVTVTVPARAAVDILEQPADLEVTAADVALGYKDVTARYRVRHNDRNGYLLQISTSDGPVQWIVVRGLDVDVTLHDAVAIPRPGAPFEQDLALDFRFVLDPSTPPGTFPLPLRVAAQPI